LCSVYEVCVWYAYGICGVGGGMWCGVCLCVCSVCVCGCVCVVCICVWCVCVCVVCVYVGGGVELLNEIAFLIFLSQIPIAMFVCMFVQNTLTLKFISITIFTGEMRVSAKIV